LQEGGKREEKEMLRSMKLIYLFKIGSHYVAQAGIELDILLPPPSKVLKKK
jgi:hypothetical protein